MMNRTWLRLLEEHDVRYLALHPDHDRSLLNTVKNLPDWKVDMQNTEVVFLVRIDPHLAF